MENEYFRNFFENDFWKARKVFLSTFRPFSVVIFSRYHFLELLELEMPSQVRVRFLVEFSVRVSSVGTFLQLQKARRLDRRIILSILL